VSYSAAIDAVIGAGGWDTVPDFGGEQLSGTFALPPGFVETVYVLPGIVAIDYPQPIYGTTGGNTNNGVMAWWTDTGMVDPSVAGATANQNPYSGVANTVIYVDDGGNKTQVICNGDSTVTVTASDGSVTTVDVGLTQTWNVAISQGVVVVTDYFLVGTGTPMLAVCNGGGTSQAFSRDNWRLVDLSKNTDIPPPAGTGAYWLCGQATAKPK
jgi:hypothetical protein